MKFACYTLGCKGQPIRRRRRWSSFCYSRAGIPSAALTRSCADSYIINHSCTVTAVSTKKSRNAIRRVRKLRIRLPPSALRLLRQGQPGRDPQAGRRRAHRHRRPRSLRPSHDRSCRHAPEMGALDDAGPPRAFEILPAGGLCAGPGHFQGRGRVQQFLHLLHHPPCPRPRVRSMPLQAAVEQAKRLAAEGYREIVINGIEISSWGWESGTAARCAAAAGGALRGGPAVRIRLGSAGAAHHRRGLLQDALRLPQSLPAVPPESAVRLGYRPAADAPPVRYRAVSRKRPAAAAVFPRLRRLTDLIVGFPGETEEEFGQSLDFCGPAAFRCSTSSPIPAARGRPPPPCPADPERRQGAPRRRGRGRRRRA